MSCGGTKAALLTTLQHGRLAREETDQEVTGDKGGGHVRADDGARVSNRVRVRLLFRARVRVMVRVKAAAT